MSDEQAESSFKLYHYDPSVAAAVVFVILFLATTLYHVWQMAKQRTWFFTAFIIGGIFEFLGYGARAASARQAPEFTLMPYIMQSLLLLLGPSFFAASIYMVLGRIIRLTGGERHSLIRPSWLTKIFVVGDVLSFFVQSGGGGMLANAKTQDETKLANNIVLSGLFLQVAFFAFFVVVTATWHKRMHGAPTTTSLASTLPWARYLWILYLASFLIMVRCIFRIAEYAGGQGGVLLSSEIYLYIFDATLMFFVMAIFNFQHPSMVISRSKVYDHRMEQLYTSA
ncbi:hypothetical protein MBLNU13_g02970t1 [Cladosporium sp. NU13]